MHAISEDHFEHLPSVWRSSSRPVKIIGLMDRFTASVLGPSVQVDSQAGGFCPGHPDPGGRARVASCWTEQTEFSRAFRFRNGNTVRYQRASMGQKGQEKEKCQHTPRNITQMQPEENLTIQY